MAGRQKPPARQRLVHSPGPRWLNDIIYTWVSSSKQADKAGFKRQQERCEITAGKTKTVKEVVNGSLPATDRTQLVDILTQNPSKKVFIENPHALARSTVAGEQSRDCFHGAVATWAGKSKSKKQVAHTIGPSKSKVQGQPWSK